MQQPVISIIDDDLSLREALLDLMSSLGFAAEAFASAQAFLDSGTLREGIMPCRRRTNARLERT